MTKLLILTASYGEGHNAAARNLAAAAKELAGPASAPVVDLFGLAAPRVDRVARAAYLAAINRAPRLWSTFYRWIDRRQVFPRHLWLVRGASRALPAVIRQEQPGAIAATYPLYGFLLERLARAGGLTTPFFNVVTDSLTINSLWTRPACTGWFVPNEETAEVMRAAGVPPERLHALGFPVPAFFHEHAADLAPPPLAEGAAPRVLFIIHSGVRQAGETARRLLAEPDWEVTLAVGRDERLRHRLAPLAAGRSRPARVLGWTDEVPRLLMTHHVVLSKAGGATTQEAIAARCPMLVTQIVPGQEEGNYELLRRHNVGALVETPEAAIAALQRAFADRGTVWSRWRAALTPLARPDASLAIAARLLDSVAAAADATAA